MNRKEIDKLWNKALRDAVEDGEMYTRYHFAALVEAAEREACAKLCEGMGHWVDAKVTAAAAIRARGNT